MSDPRFQLSWLDDRFAVCRLDSGGVVPSWASAAGASLVSVTRTDEELSVVAPEHLVPPSVRAERGWVGLRVAGPLDFSLVGVLATLTATLAAAEVPVFVISTYDTDLILVKADRADQAAIALADVADLSDHPHPPSREIGRNHPS